MNDLVKNLIKESTEDCMGVKYVNHERLTHLIVQECLDVLKKHNNYAIMAVASKEIEDKFSDKKKLLEFMPKDIPVQEWIDNGYKRHAIHPESRQLNKLADFLLQKRFDDENGKKYFITVYCYDRKKYPVEYQKHAPEIGYMATVQFILGDDNPTFDIEMNNVNSIKEVEEYFDMFWETFKRPYYEKFYE